MAYFAPGVVLEVRGFEPFSRILMMSYLRIFFDFYAHRMHILANRPCQKSRPLCPLTCSLQQKVTQRNRAKRAPGNVKAFGTPMIQDDKLEASMDCHRCGFVVEGTMTMQVLDIALYQGEEFSIVGWNGGRIFDPEKFGIEVAPLHTGCYRGCRCVFQIENGAFWLEAMKIRARNGYYPVINSSHPIRHGPISGEGEASYEHLHLKLSYNGTLRIGRDLIEPYYVSLFAPPSEWMYSRLLEVTLANGSVESIHDASDQMAELRKREKSPLTWMESQRRQLHAIRKHHAAVERRKTYVS